MRLKEELQNLTVFKQVLILNIVNVKVEFFFRKKVINFKITTLCSKLKLTRSITCLQVLHENNVKKEELKARAVALKILGKIFQVQYLPQFVQESSLLTKILNTRGERD